jgi:lipid-A-disaccharide synthase
LWRYGEALAPRVQLLFGHADFALRAADVALVASGTATLEAAMLGCPQVVSYRVSKITYAIVRNKINSRFVSLPNIMANDWCIPELLQNAATPEALVSAMRGLIEHEPLRTSMRGAYSMMGEALQSPATASFDPMVDAVLAQLR